MTDYRLIKTGVLSNLREVRLYDETLEHVKVQHEGIPVNLPCIQTAVDSALTRPTHVESSRHPNSVVFVDAGSTNASGDPLRVPVRIVEEGSGRVTTFFFATTTASPQVIWRRESDE